MKKVKTRIITLTNLISLVTALIITGTMTIRNINDNKRSISIQKESLYEEYDKKIKEQVDIAISMIDSIYNETKTGKLTLDEAKKESADLLRRLTFGEEGYFWADTVEGVNVVYLGKDVEGTNRINTQDIKGNYMIKEIIENGKKEDGGYKQGRYSEALQ